MRHEFLENLVNGLSGRAFNLVAGWIGFMEFHGLRLLCEESMTAADWAELQAIARGC